MSFKKNISIIVDYAHEPESMEQLLSTLSKLRESGVYNKIIHIVSCDGNGRDDWKKPILGEISYKHGDFCVVTLDNYGKTDNPQTILELLSSRMGDQSKFAVNQSRDKAFDLALQQAILYAKQDFKVLIVSTGVGVEYGLSQPNGILEWNEKEIWKNKFNTLTID